MNLSTQQAQVLSRLSSGVKTARELTSALGISQPTLSRLLESLITQVVKLGKARATRYGLLRKIRNGESHYPIYRVTPEGDIAPLGELLILANNQFWWEPRDEPGELFDYLPWFLQDMRPNGFMGRAFAYAHGRELDLPPDLRNWTDDHLMLALSRYGADCSGNQIIGSEAMNRFWTQQHPAPRNISLSDCPRAYPAFAEEAMAGEAPGSSAGGEQPKFGALLEDEEGQLHVLVKFSPRHDTTSGRRWADLLVCEHLALEVITQKGVAAARSRLVDAGGRMFLESIRFDRLGQLGRQALYSLNVVDAEYVGDLRDWAWTAFHLEKLGMIGAEDAHQIHWLWSFGALIANTDMHFGNLSLFMGDGRRKFTLAPI